MEALEALLQRVSVARLGDPAPTAAQRELLFRAALRAPDHGQLRPWRFLTVEGEARVALGELFARAQQARDPQAPAALLDKARGMPLRAPLLIVAIASLKAHAKVPAQEQLLSAGCVAHNLLLGAHALGYGAQWLTGWAAYDAAVATLLGLAAHERIVGFIHIGTAREEAPERPRPTPADVVSDWAAP